MWELGQLMVVGSYLHTALNWPARSRTGSPTPQLKRRKGPLPPSTKKSWPQGEPVPSTILVKSEHGSGVPLVLRRMFYKHLGFWGTIGGRETYQATWLAESSTPVRIPWYTVAEAMEAVAARSVAVDLTGNCIFYLSKVHYRRDFEYRKVNGRGWLLRMCRIDRYLRKNYISA